MNDLSKNFSQSLKMPSETIGCDNLIEDEEIICKSHFETEGVGFEELNSNLTENNVS
jgi:hypothetical protein